MSHLRQLYHGRHAASNLEDVSKIVFMPHFSPSVRTGQHGSTWVNWDVQFGWCLVAPVRKTQHLVMLWGVARRKSSAVLGRLFCHIGWQESVQYNIHVYNIVYIYNDNNSNVNNHSICYTEYLYIYNSIHI